MRQSYFSVFRLSRSINLTVPSLSHCKDICLAKNLDEDPISKFWYTDIHAYMVRRRLDACTKASERLQRIEAYISGDRQAAVQRRMASVCSLFQRIVHLVFWPLTWRLYTIRYKNLTEHISADRGCMFVCVCVLNCICLINVYFFFFFFFH